jgi:hypothetical protein
MKAKLDSFANKASTGKYPGGKEIDNGIVLLAGLTEQQSSFYFIEHFLASNNDLLDYDEDYQDLENFFETQFATWQKLAKALNQEFDRNRIALEKDDKASKAIQTLVTIYNNPRPYRDIRNIEPLIAQVANVNNNLISEKRTHAKARVKHRIEQVKQQIEAAKVPSELSHKALRPLQLALQNIDDLQGVADILQEQADSINLVEDADALINQYIDQQEAARVQAIKQAELDANKKQEEAKRKQEEAEKKGEPIPVFYKPIIPKAPQKTAEPTPKKIVSVDTSSVMLDVNLSGVIETEQDIDTYLNALRDKLSTLVAANNKVRIK